MTRKNFVLLQSLSRDVRGKILRIHDALFEIQPLWDQLVTIIHVEDATHIKLDVIAFLLRLKQIVGSMAEHEQQRTELKLAIMRLKCFTDKWSSQSFEIDL